MFSRFLFSFLSLSVASAQANILSYGDQQPILLLTADDNIEDRMKLLNTVNGAMAYSIVANKIRNGSGNKFEVRPLQTQNILQQALRQVSLFDLYMQRGLEEAKIKKLKVGLHLFPNSADLDNRLNNFGNKQLEELMKDIAEPLRPSLTSLVKLEKPEKLKNADVIQAARDAQIQAAGKRYPNVTSYNDNGDGLSKAAWLLFSYLPLSISTTYDFEGSGKSTAKTTIIQPAPGIPEWPQNKSKIPDLRDVKLKPFHFSIYPETENATVFPASHDGSVPFVTDIRFHPEDEKNRQFASSAEKNIFLERSRVRAMKIDFIKDYSPENKHFLEMALSFGYLPRVATDFNNLNMDELKTRADWEELAKNIDFGLIVRGNLVDIDKTGKVLGWDREKKAWTRSEPSVIDRIADLFEIRLVFHKVHFLLDRKFIDDPALTYLRAPENVGNLNLFLKEDVGFRIASATLNKEKSNISIRLSLKRGKMKELEGIGKFFTHPIQKNIAEHFCAYSRTYEEGVSSGLSSVVATYISPLSRDMKGGVRYSECEINFANYKDFKGFWLNNLNNLATEKFNDEIKRSIDYQAKRSEGKIDMMVENVSKQVLESIVAAQYNLDAILKPLR